MRRVAANATAMPAKPPISANITLSISACRIWRETGAPSAAWIDVWAFARGGTDEHEVRHIDTGDCQDKCGNPHQQVQAQDVLVAKHSNSGTTRREVERLFRNRRRGPRSWRWAIGLSSHCRNSTCICVPIC